MKKVVKYSIIIVIIISSITMMIYGFSYAKYASNSVWNHYLESKGFYFTSADLSQNNISNVNNFWDGNSVYFSIKNSSNSYVTTEFDINYEVTCTIDDANGSCLLNGTETNTYTGTLSSFEACTNNTEDGVDVSLLDKTTCEISGYNWLKQEAIKSLYFDVLSDLTDVNVSITVTSTSPYKKTLKGEFNLHKTEVDEGSINFTYNNFDLYDQAIISNSYLENKCIKLNWDSSKAIIDVDKSKLSSYATDSDGYLNEIHFNINSHDSIEYIFHSKDFNTLVSKNIFTLEEIGC